MDCPRHKVPDPGGRAPLKCATLRFQDPAMEESFLAKRKRALVFRSMVVMGIIAVGHAGFIFIIVVLFKVHRRAPPDVHPIDAMTHRLQLYVTCLNLVSCLTFVQVLRSKRFVDKVGTAALEIVLVSVMTFGMIVTVLLPPSRACRLLGYDFRQILNNGRGWYESDSNVALVLIGTVAVVHATLPIRWFVMTPLTVVGFGTFPALVLVIGSDEPWSSQLVNACLLFGVLVALSCGRRFAEDDDRQAFFDLTRQGHLRRPQAEYQLTKAEPTERSEPQDSPTDTVSWASSLESPYDDVARASSIGSRPQSRHASDDFLEEGGAVLPDGAALGPREEGDAEATPDPMGRRAHL